MIVSEERSCGNKVQYRTKKQAIDAKINMENENKTRMRFGVGNWKTMGQINIYFCKFCGYWHIGHETWRKA